MESRERSHDIAARRWFLNRAALCVCTLICIAVFQPPIASAAPPAGTRAAAAAAADAEVAAVEASFGWHGDPLGHLDGIEGAAFVAPCLPSGLAGFSHSVVLSEAGLILHWVRRNLLFLEFALEARFGSGAENGWVAVGWSHDGRMVPSMAIVGSPAGTAAQNPGGRGIGSGGGVGVLGKAAGVASYAISGYKRDDVRLLVEGAGNGGGGEVGSGGEGWSIYTSARGSTVMRFSRSLVSNPPILNTSTTGISAATEGSPSNEPTYSMSHHVIWAYSDRQEDVLRYHGKNRGSAFVDYMCDLLASPARQSCQPSSLPGYTCMLQLNGDSFILHWHLTPSSLLLAADVATTGWVALGWSKDGKMTGSEAAIGNLPRGTSRAGGGADVATGQKKEQEQAVGSFLIGGYERSAIRPAPKPTCAPSLSALRCPPLSTLVTTTISTPPPHTPPHPTPSHSPIFPHLTSLPHFPPSPFSPPSCRFERPLVNGQLPLSSADVATIIWAYSNEGSRKLTFHGNNSHAHAGVGIAVLVLLLVFQPLVIFLRPLSNGNGSIDQSRFAMWTRSTWHWVHWAVGIVAVVMGWASIFLGMNLYFSFIGSDPFGLEAFLGIIMALFVIVYMLFVCRDQLESSKLERPQYSAYASRA
ncbi:unnamed protein product [Closterium sp. Yama58-4]|nr:unnamed protein product [Closterium sp. Yama58-4]